MTMRPTDDEIIMQLRRASRLLERLIQSVPRISSGLSRMEQDYAAEKPQAQVVYKRQNPRAIICLTSALIPKDPFALSLSRIVHDASWPSLLRADEPTESAATCKTIMDTILPEVVKLNGDVLVINLKWSRMSDHLEKTNAAIIGTRFMQARTEKLESIRKCFSNVGMEVYYDEGFYGGGPLIYGFVRALSDNADATVIEVTLSQTAAESVDMVRSLFQAVPSI